LVNFDIIIFSQVKIVINELFNAQVLVDIHEFKKGISVGIREQSIELINLGHNFLGIFLLLGALNLRFGFINISNLEAKVKWLAQELNVATLILAGKSPASGKFTSNSWVINDQDSRHFLSRSDVHQLAILRGD